MTLSHVQCFTLNEKPHHRHIEVFFSCVKRFPFYVFWMLKSQFPSTCIASHSFVHQFVFTAAGVCTKIQFHFKKIYFCESALTQQPNPTNRLMTCNIYWSMFDYRFLKFDWEIWYLNFVIITPSIDVTAVHKIRDSLLLLFLLFFFFVHSSVVVS